MHDIPDEHGRDSDADRTGLSPKLLAALAAHPREMAELVAVFSTRVADHGGLLDLMQAVAVQAVRLLSGVRWAGVTAQFSSVPFTIAHTDARVLIVDEGQYRTHDGPCLRAMRTARPVHMRIGDIRAAWPLLADTATDAGVRAVLALPIITHGATTAVLNLYSDTPGGIDHPDPDVATVLIDYLRRGTQDFLTAQPGDNAEIRFRQAMHNRAVTDAAVGVVMARHDLDTIDARSLLRAQAHRRGVTTEGYAEQLLIPTATPTAAPG